MGPTTTGRQQGPYLPRDCWGGVLVYTERVGGSSPSGCTWLGVADLLGFCGSWRFSWGWWCPSVVPPFGSVCGGVGWGDDNRTTTESGDNEAAPPPEEVAGRCAAAVTGLAAAGAGRTEGMAGGAPHTLPVHHPVAIAGASFTGARAAYPATATFSHVLFVPIQAPMSAAGIRLSGTLAAAATPLAGVVSPDGVDGSRDEFHVVHIYTPSRATQVVDHEVSLNVSEVRHPCRTVGASHALHAVQGEGELAVAAVVHGASPQNAPAWSRRTASGQPLLNGQDEDAGDMTDSGRLQASPSLLAQVSGSGPGVRW